MGTKLTHNIGFSAVVVDGARVFPNTYNLKLNMLITTDNRSCQNIALQRILFFINEVFGGSIFINASNENANKFQKLAKDSHVIVFPDDPFDQIIGMILFNKLESIAESFIEMESIEIGSNISPNLFYTIDEFEGFESELEEPWWIRADLTTTDDPKIAKKIPSWEDINLGWEENEEVDVDILLEDASDVIVLEGGEEKENEK